MLRHSLLGIITALLVFGANLQAKYFAFEEGSKNATLETKSSNVRGTKEVAFTLTVPGIEVTKGQDGFDTIHVTDLYHSSKVGNPDVVSTGTIIAVPPGFEPSIQITSEESVDLKDVV